MRINYFLCQLIWTYLKRALISKAPLTKSMIWILQNMTIIRENCITNKLFYQRDFYMFKNVVMRSYGNKIFFPVGLFHLPNLTKFFSLYKEACAKFYPELKQYEELNVKNLPSIEEVIERNQKALEIEAKILEHVDFHRGKVYCNHTHA